MRFVLALLFSISVAAVINSEFDRVEIERNWRYLEREEKHDFIKSSLEKALTIGDLSSVKWLLSFDETSTGLVSSLEIDIEVISPECMNEIDKFNYKFEQDFYTFCRSPFPAHLQPYLYGPFSKRYLTGPMIVTGIKHAIDGKAYYGISTIIESDWIKLVPDYALEDFLITFCANGDVGPVRSLLKFTSVNPACQGNKPLKISVQQNKSSVLDVLLDTPGVDPAYNNHQLILGDLSNIGPFTISHLLNCPTFDPSAHHCRLPLQLYQSDNFECLAIVLSYPTVDLHCFDELLSETPGNEVGESRQTIVRSMVSLCEFVRCGDLESIKVLNFRELDDARILAMYMSSFTFNKPHIVKFIYPHKSSGYNMSFGISLAAKLDNMECLEMLFKSNDRFKHQFSLAHCYAYIGLCRKTGSKKTFEFFFQYFMRSSSKEFVQLMAEFEDPNNPNIHRSVDLIWQYVEKNFESADVVKEYIIARLAIKLFPFEELVEEIIEHISDMVIFDRLK